MSLILKNNEEDLKLMLLDPKQVMTQYSLWTSCKQVPVAYEKQPDYFSMFNECVLLPSKYFIAYLDNLRKTPFEITQKQIFIRKQKLLL